MTRVVHTAADLRSHYDVDDVDDVAESRKRAVVMTMGALHRGHAALMDAARSAVGPQGLVIVTIFVNPRQFAPGEDFARYPRTLDADVEVCRDHGVDLVFAPTVDEIYNDSVVPMTAGERGDILEGAVRPGHFDGVLTVVRRLLEIVEPQVAMFGEKDYQQLVLIRSMVEALRLPVAVVGVATVRDEDGVALSSRNSYLDDVERVQARALWQALEAGNRVASQGVCRIIEAAQAVLDEHGLVPDYVSVADADLRDADSGEARLLIATRVGSTRLIDNARVDLGVSA
jgi:pantoate--beta-alanine ligase